MNETDELKKEIQCQDEHDTFKDIEEKEKTLMEDDQVNNHEEDSQIESIVVEVQLSNESNINKQHSYRSELDGLRAIAILAVMFYHAEFSFFRGGFVGVDIFFVLSGYLMTSIITRESEKKEFTLLKFYERRIRRILPMLYFTIIVFYFPAYKYLVDKEFVKFTKSALLASIGMSNFFFAHTTKGYFDTSTDLVPLVHTWTLGVEEQFYVIIPLLFFVFWRLGRNCVLAVLVLLTLVSFGLTLDATKYPVYKFYMLHTRFWELAIGSLIVFIPKQKESDVFSLTGLCAIFSAILGFKESMPDPSYFTLLPTLGTALFIVYTKSETIVGRVMSFKPLIWIGLISYSAYLIHQPLFVFVRLQFMSSKIENQFVYVGLIILTQAISYLTWRFVENPFRDKKRISFQTIFILIFLYFLFVRPEFLFSFSKQQLSHDQGDITITSNTNLLIQNLKNQSSVSTDMPSDSLFEVGFISIKYCGQNNQNVPRSPVPLFCRLSSASLNSSSVPVLKNNQRGQNMRVNEWTTGGGNNSIDESPPVYFLYGDSMASALTPAFVPFAYPGIFGVINGGECHSLLVKNDADQYVDTTHGYKCHDVTKAVYEFIKSTPSISEIYLTQVWSWRVNEIAEHFEYTLNAYAALNVHVNVIQQPPIQKYEVKHLYKHLLDTKNLSNASLRENSLKRVEYVQQQAEVEKEFLKYKYRRGVRFIYLEDLLCDSEYCPVGTAQVPYYIDKLHLAWPKALKLRQRIIEHI